MTRYSNDVKRLLERRGAMKARDGAVINPVVDETNGVQWFFKYRKNSPGPYKWLAMGQQEPLVLQTLATLTCSPINTWQLAASGIVIPFSGEYWPRIEAGFSSTAISTAVLGVFLDGNSASTVGQTYNETIAVAGGGMCIDIEDELPRIAQAQHTWSFGIQANVLTLTSANQGLKVRPRRISI